MTRSRNYHNGPNPPIYYQTLLKSQHLSKHILKLNGITWRGGQKRGFCGQISLDTAGLRSFILLPWSSKRGGEYTVSWSYLNQWMLLSLIFYLKRALSSEFFKVWVPQTTCLRAAWGRFLKMQTLVPIQNLRPCVETSPDGAQESCHFIKCTRGF